MRTETRKTPRVKDLKRPAKKKNTAGLGCNAALKGRTFNKFCDNFMSVLKPFSASSDLIPI